MCCNEKGDSKVFKIFYMQKMLIGMAEEDMAKAGQVRTCEG